MKPVCYCKLDSPFRWKDCPRPSIFAGVPEFRAKGLTPTNEKKVEEPPTKLTAEDKFLAITRLKTFHVFNRAGGLESYSETSDE